MLFRRKHKPDAPPAPATDPVIDAQIHWLAKRGLVVRDGLSKEQWIGAADDPSDPMSLAEATIDGMPCAQPDPTVTINGTDLAEMVHLLADSLELPIDDVEYAGGELKIRSSATHLSFTIEGHDHLAVLHSIAQEFIDSAHVLVCNGNTFAIAHRDIAEQVQSVMDLTRSGD